MSEGATGELGRALLSKKKAFVQQTIGFVRVARVAILAGARWAAFFTVDTRSNAVLTRSHGTVRSGGREWVARMLDRGNGEGDMWAAWEGGGWRWKGLVARAGDCGRQTRDERRETRDPVRIAL